MSPRALRAVGAAWLVFLLIWLPFEDTSILFPAVLALDATIWLALRGWPLWTTLGDVFIAALAAGAWLAAAPVFALGLMIFKGGLHGHGFPDFTLGQVGWVALAIPACAVLGTALGAGVFLFRQRD